MLDSREASIVQQLFGTSYSQVRKDHAISHVLSVLPNFNTDLVFYGGTGLARTFLNLGRLSEDIDLFTSNRGDLLHELDSIPELINQEFPEAYWLTKPSQMVDPGKALLVCERGIQIEVQAISTQLRGWQQIPVEIMQIHQRYSDIPKTHLAVPTLDGFIAMKALAWFDRKAARDLYDLEGLSQVSEVTGMVRELIHRITGNPVSQRMLNLKIVGSWQEELSHQTKLEKTEEECLARVLKWWGN